MTNLPNAQSKKPNREKDAIGGYCPVAYVAAGKALKGDPRFTVEHEGHLYQFVSEDAKKLFVEDPSQYQIKYEGYCATAAAYGKKLSSDPRIFTVHSGATYLFSAAEAKATFDKDTNNLIPKADENWPRLK